MKTRIVEIALQNPNRYPEAAARRLRPWLLALLGELAPAGWRSLGVRFAGDRGVRRANRVFRGKDQPTDVLSFPGRAGAQGAQGAGGHLGDILISVPAARRQAATAGHGAEREVRVLLLHGVLHCLGHDHETDGGEMERLERRLRRRWIGPEATLGTVRRGAGTREAATLETGTRRARTPGAVAIGAGRRGARGR